MLNDPVFQGSIGHQGSGGGASSFAAAAKTFDTGIIVLMLVLPAWLYSATWHVRYTTALLSAIIVFHICAGLMTLYRAWRGESASRQFMRILAIWGITVFALLALSWMFKETRGFSRVVLTSWFLATPTLMFAWRMLARMFLVRWMDSTTSRRGVLIWGSGDHATQLANVVQGSDALGLRLVEHMRYRGPGDCETPGSPSNNSDSTARDQLSGPEILELRARRGEYAILYIVLGSVPKAAAIDTIERLSDTTVSVYLVPDYFSTHLFHGRWSSLEGVPLVSVFDSPFWGADGWLKKLEDIAVGSLILLAAAVPMLFIALAVKLTSTGPILFRQRRYGIDGKEIQVMKFRSMTVTEDGANVKQAQRGDARFTPIGEFLRRHSLDELPQFFNVIRGEMSIVGPRPHAIAHNEFYRNKVKGYMLRHKVKPGITGWAQINGWRGETDDLYKMQKRIEHDLWYIQNWSFSLDIKIIALTILRGFTGPNAY